MESLLVKGLWHIWTSDKKDAQSAAKKPKKERKSAKKQDAGGNRDVEKEPAEHGAGIWMTTLGLRTWLPRFFNLNLVILVTIYYSVSMYCRMFNVFVRVFNCVKISV